MPYIPITMNRVNKLQKNRYVSVIHLPLAWSAVAVNVGCLKREGLSDDPCLSFMASWLTRAQQTAGCPGLLVWGQCRPAADSIQKKPLLSADRAYIELVTSCNSVSQKLLLQLN